jgi:hypothetical protein
MLQCRAAGKFDFVFRVMEIALVGFSYIVVHPNRIMK